MNLNIFFFQVRDNSAMGSLIKKLCGRELPRPIESHSNVMHVKFRTDYSNAGKGFYATYYASEY